MSFAEPAGYREMISIAPELHKFSRDFGLKPFEINTLSHFWRVYRSAREYSIHSAQRLGGGESASRLQAC